MRRISIPLMLSLSALLSLSPSPKNAEALPFLDVGPKVGYGVGVFTGLDSKANQSSELLAGGIAATFDLVMIQLEVDLLYINAKTESSLDLAGVEQESSSSSSFFAMPIIGRLDISPVPMFKLALGGGYERRFSLEDDAGDTELNYLPLSVRADLKIPLIGTAGIEGRFNYQMGDEDIKAHEFMLYLHAFL